MGWCLRASAFFLCGGVSKWGLRLVREPLLRGRIGAGGEGSAACLVPRLCLERCGWGVGIGRIGPIVIGLLCRPQNLAEPTSDATRQNK